MNLGSDRRPRRGGGDTASLFPPTEAAHVLRAQGDHLRASLNLCTHAFVCVCCVMDLRPHLDREDAVCAMDAGEG